MFDLIQKVAAGITVAVTASVLAINGFLGHPQKPTLAPPTSNAIVATENSQTSIGSGEQEIDPGYASPTPTDTPTPEITEVDILGKKYRCPAESSEEIRTKIATVEKYKKGNEDPGGVARLLQKASVNLENCTLSEE